MTDLLRKQYDELAADNARLIAASEDLANENERLREALTIIARGVWTAKNSVETMVWTARQALKPTD